MPSPLSRLNEADYPPESGEKIKAKINRKLFEEMQTKFGIMADHEDTRDLLSKTLHSAAKNALAPPPSPQAKELERLKKAIDRSVAAFEKISTENRYEIDSAILYRAPFNSRFYFKEQIQYWERNENPFQTALNKLAQISHALDTISFTRKSNFPTFKRTINTPLDHLIEDLTDIFEVGTERRAHRHCHYDPNIENYTGQFFEFVLFILIHFAPRSYHSQLALGKRIGRALDGLK
jgi:hypothetical protein